MNIRKATLKNGMPVTLLWSDFPFYAVMDNGDEYEVSPGTVAIEHGYGVIVRRHAELQFYIQEPWPMDDIPSGG